VKNIKYSTKLDESGFGKSIKVSKREDGANEKVELSQ
jgi:hypothetical protein